MAYHVGKLLLAALGNGLWPEGGAPLGAGVVQDIEVQHRHCLPDFAAEGAPAVHRERRASGDEEACVHEGLY